MSERKRLHASEREGMLRLGVCYDILHTERDELAERCAMVPYGKRDMAMIAATIESLMTRLLKTIPDDQLLIYQRSLATRSYMIGSKRPGAVQRDEEQYGMWLPFNVINELLKGLHDHCLMCGLDKARRRACPLKKALDTIPNDTRDMADGDCQYAAII